MNQLIGTEGRPGTEIRGLKGTPEWDGSHSPGAGGRTVPGHWDVWYEDQNGVVRKQRYKGNGDPFTEEENANIEVPTPEAEDRRKAKRKERRDQSMNAKKRDRGDDQMCKDVSTSSPNSPTPSTEDQSTAQPNEQSRREIPEPAYDEPSWADLYGDYLNPFSTPGEPVDGLDTALRVGKGTSAVVGVASGAAALILSGLGLAAGGAAAGGATAAGGPVIAGSIGPGSSGMGSAAAASIAAWLFGSDW